MTKAKPIEITESCGCVFCDLGLEPDNTINGRPVHTDQRRRRSFLCTKPASALAPGSMPSEDER